jgi:hypothetical protein
MLFSFALPTLASLVVVHAAETGSWAVVRDRISRLFGRGQPDPDAETRLDATRRRLAEARPEDKWRVREELAQQWRDLFAGLLAEYPPAEAELTGLLEDLPEATVWLREYGGSVGSSPDGGAAEAPRPYGESAAVIGAIPAEPDTALAPEPETAPAPRPAPEPDAVSAPATTPARPATPAPAEPAEAPAPSPVPVPHGPPALDTWSARRKAAAPGPSEQTATPSLRDDPVTAAIRAAVKPGVLAFNPPPEMRQGRRERVEVGIARSPELRNALLEGLRGHGEVQFEAVPTSLLMGVELRGSSFEIEAFSPLEQVVAPAARWEFDVRPLRAGLQTLTLCVSMRVEALAPPLGAGGRIGVPVLERQIRIRVSVGYGTRTFLVVNWRWLIATGAAIAMAAAAWAAIVH